MRACSKHAYVSKTSHIGASLVRPSLSTSLVMLITHCRLQLESEIERLDVFALLSLSKQLALNSSLAIGLIILSNRPTTCDMSSAIHFLYRAIL